MSILSATPTTMPLLTPFLSLQAQRLVLGFTRQSDSGFVSEDWNEHALTGAAEVAATAQGAPYVDLPGTSFGGFSLLDSAWEAPTGPFTMLVAFRPDLVQTIHFIGKWGEGDQRSFRLHLQDDRDVVFDVSDDGDTIVSVSRGSYNLSSWNLAAAVYTGTEIKVWLNGQTASNSTGIPSALNASSTSPFDIGKRETDLSETAYNGRIALVGVYGGNIPDAFFSRLQAHMRRYGLN